MEILIGILGSGLISWWITHFYYKKSLHQQSTESQKEIKELLKDMENLENLKDINKNIFMAKVLDEAIEEYRRSGTPVRLLDSYDNLSLEEKADLYDKVMFRVKGRLGKSNKYRKQL